MQEIRRGCNDFEMATRSRAARRWLLVGYGGLAGFFALEALTRKPGAASSLAASPDDRGTTRMIVTGYVVAAEAPLTLRRIPLPQLPQLAGPVGLALQASGLALRTWSMRTLGTSYTRTLRTEDHQHVIDTGPYRFVRHPGYAGSLLTWTGFGLTSRSIPVIILVAALLGRAYQQRIVTEEKLLQRELPGYAEYIHRTKRLVPFVW
jgi:protein-S-isoprenylcysteine O-methyltransferase Ste14